VVIKYALPHDWIRYHGNSIAGALVEAKAAILALREMPYQRSWVETLQQIELKREVAGTSRIEGAVFTEKELEAALKETPEQLFTRSQRQAHAAARAYRWIGTLPADRPVDSGLILEIHREIVTGADDDHCPPGEIRRRDQNVEFGTPRHRGAEGGEECAGAFEGFSQAIQREYRDHDPLVQALAAHYHLAAMHPFLDGNGRTARAVEALMLARAGLHDTCFIAISNYYYEEKARYLSTLNAVRSNDHDLTPFLVFSLEGIALQAKRLLSEIRREVSKALFRGMMLDLFGRLKTPRRRVIAQRQIVILEILLRADWTSMENLIQKAGESYDSLKNSEKALVRDMMELIDLRAVRVRKDPEGRFHFGVRLEWPTKITETEFFKLVKRLPKTKTHSFLP